MAFQLFQPNSAIRLIFQLFQHFQLFQPEWTSGPLQRGWSMQGRDIGKLKLEGRYQKIVQKGVRNAIQNSTKFTCGRLERNVILLHHCPRGRLGQKEKKLK